MYSPSRSPLPSFPNFEPVRCSMSGSNCCFLTCVQVSQETGQVVWHSHLFKKFPQFVVIHTVKGYSIVNEAEVDVLLEFSCFLYKPMNVGNLISGSSAFLNSVWTSGSSGSCTIEAWLEEFWALLCQLVSWVQLCDSLDILWHCHFGGLEWKLIFSSPVATAEFFKFAGILSLAL